MLLLATATETNHLRENDTGNPPLGRADAPRDTSEGYGVVNIDAAIEAATLTWDLADPIVGSSDGGSGDRRAWARKITVPKGETLKLALTSPPTGDFDIYVYTTTPTEQGTPQLRASSTRAGLGLSDEMTSTFADDTELYAVVKRIAGSGTFTLRGATFHCANGTLEPGEECDDGNTTVGDCCSATCQLEKTTACGYTEPQGAVDAGVDDGGADASDAGELPDVTVPPIEEPPAPDAGPPPVAPIPTTTATAYRPSAPVERLEAGGGGCATTPGTSLGGGSIGLALACAVAIRRARRRRYRRA
jgi:cysteine-rich repeat protein